MTTQTSKRRSEKAAPPLGERQETASNNLDRETGNAERRSAGGQSPNAKAVGDIFER